MARRRRRPQSDGKIYAELRDSAPSRGLTIRGERALALLVDGGESIPRTAFEAKDPLVAVYGDSAKPPIDGGWMLGVMTLKTLERHPIGKGTRIRLYPAAPWTVLSAEQVDRLRELAHGRVAAPGARSRPSALAAERLDA